MILQQQLGVQQLNSDTKVQGQCTPNRLRAHSHKTAHSSYAKGQLHF